MRAYYLIRNEAWAAAAIAHAQPDDVVVVATHDGVVALLAPVSPYVALEGLGGIRVGSKLEQLIPLHASLFTKRTVDRDRTVGRRTITDRIVVPATDLQEDDVVVGPATPRVVFAGDDPADY